MTVPDDAASAACSAISPARRGRVTGSHGPGRHGRWSRRRCRWPELFGYATRLRSRTQGRGTFQSPTGPPATRPRPADRQPPPPGEGRGNELTAGWERAAEGGERPPGTSRGLGAAGAAPRGERGAPPRALPQVCGRSRAALFVLNRPPGVRVENAPPAMSCSVRTDWRLVADHRETSEDRPAGSTAPCRCSRRWLDPARPVAGAAAARPSGRHLGQDAQGRARASAAARRRPPGVVPGSSS